jgi:hypothetical protein
MEEQLVAARARLHLLLLTHPNWPYQEYADQLERPRDWVKRWVRRLHSTPAEDEAVRGKAWATGKPVRPNACIRWRRRASASSPLCSLPL